MNDDLAKLMIDSMRIPRRPNNFIPNPDPEPVILKISEVARDGIITILFN